MRFAVGTDLTEIVEPDNVECVSSAAITPAASN
jgi:hypothetical protein